ncbi:unnamed protein product [Fusarium venenatum]|uniref:Uncharacterized protein n=1 Tax=Fusarium venenatum TaxID=56646 RepID=A0A2L2STI2_9HYPO|nr:LOW QUALITY PROTEIN: uncharacterized protein FVRRES_13541 [Fusarium venenatum]CEI41357.1 unnamed protein product [Fusarium venenatum]
MSDTVRKRRHPEPTPTVGAEIEISRGLTIFGTFSQQLTPEACCYFGKAIGYLSGPSMMSKEDTLGSSLISSNSGNEAHDIHKNPELILPAILIVTPQSR